jgi:hypothetical protein
MCQPRGLSTSLFRAPEHNSQGHVVTTRQKFELPFGVVVAAVRRVSSGCIACQVQLYCSTRIYKQLQLLNNLYLGPDDLTPDDKYAAFFPSLTQKDFDWGIVDKVNFRKEGLEFEKPVHDAALIFWGGPWEDRKGHPKHIMLF